MSDKWADLDRDERQLQVGRHVLEILRVLKSVKPLDGSPLNIAEVCDSLSGLEAFSRLDMRQQNALIDAILCFHPIHCDDLTALVDELGLTLVDEARLLDAER